MLKAGFCLGVVALASASASGQADLGPNGLGLDVILSDFNGAFIVDDKLFEIKIFDGTGIDASQITLAAVDFGLAGVGFDMLGEWVDLPGDALATGFAMEYCVTVLNPDLRIVDAHLLFNGLATGDGSFADVNETIVDPITTNLVDELTVFSLGTTGAGQFEDVWEADPYTFDNGFERLEIIKDFELFANGTGGTAGASFIRQTFSQIPAPGGVMLAGVAGLVAVRRRR